MGIPARIEIPAATLDPALASGVAAVGLPELILFEFENFNVNYAGQEDGDCWRTTLNFRYVGDEWRDGISSIIVLSGVWEIYEHADYQGEREPPIQLGPGHYPTLASIGMRGGIKSFRVAANGCSPGSGANRIK